MPTSFGSIRFCTTRHAHKHTPRFSYLGPSLLPHMSAALQQQQGFMNQTGMLLASTRNWQLLIPSLFHEGVHSRMRMKGLSPRSREEPHGLVDDSCLAQGNHARQEVISRSVLSIRYVATCMSCLIRKTARPRLTAQLRFSSEST